MVRKKMSPRRVLRPAPGGEGGGAPEAAPPPPGVAIQKAFWMGRESNPVDTRPPAASPAAEKRTPTEEENAAARAPPPRAGRAGEGPPAEEGGMAVQAALDKAAAGGAGGGDPVEVAEQVEDELRSTPVISTDSREAPPGRGKGGMAGTEAGGGTKRAREEPGGGGGGGVVARHHPGELVVPVESFSELWPGLDPADVDDEAHRESFPEKFVWDCCGRWGDAEGCEEGCAPEKPSSTDGWVEAAPDPPRRRHPGELILDEENFKEIWPGMDGPDDVDDDEHRQAFPERFLWDCCGRPGDADGCQEETAGQRALRVYQQHAAAAAAVLAPGGGIGMLLEEPVVLSSGSDSSEEESEEEERVLCHPGELIVNEKDFAEMWPGLDSPADVDDDAHREAFPERYIWTCCGEPGDATGCTFIDSGSESESDPPPGFHPGEIVDLTSDSESSSSEEEAQEVSDRSGAGSGDLNGSEPSQPDPHEAGGGDEGPRQGGAGEGTARIE